MFSSCIYSNRKNAGKPDHVDSEISFLRARFLAVNDGLMGYQARQSGNNKNLVGG